MFYTPSISTGNNHECTIMNVDLPEATSMTAHSISEELSALGNSVTKRMDELAPELINSAPSVILYMTECERARMHDLKMALPKDSAEQARLRNQKRIAERNMRLGKCQLKRATPHDY